MLNSLKKTTKEMKTLYAFYTVAQKFALQYFILHLECYLEEDKGTSLNPPFAQPAGLRQQRPSGVSMNKLFWMSLCVCRAGGERGGSGTNILLFKCCSPAPSSMGMVNG